MGSVICSDLSNRIQQCQTFAEVLERSAQAWPESVFLIAGDRRWTYREFNGLVNQCCRFLRSMNLEAGHVISMILRNSIDYLVLYFASLRCRIILNPFPFHLGTQEIVSKIEFLNPNIIFCHRHHYSELKNATDVKAVNLDDHCGESFQKILSRHTDATIKARPISHNETAVLYYSSGTTGKPKLIEYTHKSMVMTQASMVRADFCPTGSTHLCVLPLGHTSSLRHTVKPCICTGSTVVLYESFWKIRTRLWSEVEKHAANYMQVVPTILITILNTKYKDFSASKSAGWEFIIGCGSAFLPQTVQEAFEEKFRIPVGIHYGLSETGATHFDDPRKPGRRTGTIGKPFDFVDVKIFDESGKEVGSDQLGEIGMKGPGILKGYYKNPELFAACLNKDGYFMTGDLGKVDADGVYCYVDRKKDLIIKGGINIAPSQIEETLQAHPDVEDVAAIGRPDVLLGEVVKVYVVLKPNSKPDTKHMIAFCRDQLGAFKAPSVVELIDQLPKGPSGKVLKRELREREAASHINKMD
jgi:long-chain acyl-CoA synthetase